MAPRKPLRLNDEHVRSVLNHHAGCITDLREFDDKANEAIAVLRQQIAEERAKREADHSIPALQGQIDGLRRDVTHIVERLQDCERVVRASRDVASTLRNRFRWLLTGR